MNHPLYLSPAQILHARTVLKAVALVEIPPDAFLYLSTPTAAWNDLMHESRSVDFYNQVALGDDQIPWISADLYSGKVIMADGRHRAAAVLKRSQHLREEAALLAALIVVDGERGPAYAIDDGPRRLFLTREVLPKILIGAWDHSWRLPAERIEMLWSEAQGPMDVTSVPAEVQ